MTKKILPVVFDRSNELSKRLTRINIAHVFCDPQSLLNQTLDSMPKMISNQTIKSKHNPNLNIGTDNGQNQEHDVYQILKTGSYSCLNKFFITSDPSNIGTIESDFPDCRVYLISIVGKEVDGSVSVVEVVTDVNEAVHNYVSEGMKFYSYKELREIKQRSSTYIHVDLDIFIVGKTTVDTMISRLASIIDSIRSYGVIDNKYIFSTINTYYCGEKKDILLKLLHVDHFIELSLPKDKKYEVYEQIKNTKLYNLINKTKYDYTWRAYKQIKEYIDLTDSADPVDQINPNNSNNIDINIGSADFNVNVNVNVNEGLIKKDNAKPKICICMDISGIDSSTKFIEINTELKDVIGSAIIINERNKNGLYSDGSSNDREKIFVIKDIFAVGTEKIMRYYLTLFDRYGLYGFKESRLEIPGCIIQSDSYKILATKGRLLSEVQLFEHIYSFGDVLLMNALNVHDNCGLVIKKKSIIIVTYYGIYEQFVFVKKALELMGYTVHNFSYMPVFNEGGDRKVVDRLKILIEQVCPNYILWWVFNISANSLAEVVSASYSTKHLYYNWDEPYNWTLVDAESKAKYISSAFITCSETTKKYIGSGSLHAYCVYPGYSPTLHLPRWLNRANADADAETDIDLMINSINYINPQNTEDYECDVSFVFTNLYEDSNMYPNQIVDRKKLVESIYLGQKIYGYTFFIYGPEVFKDMFPLSYKGFIKYEDTGKIINNSRINICTHVVGTKMGYLNERVFLILGAGGLLLVDPVPGVDNVLTNGVNCVFINQTKICQQIKSILDSYHHYKKIKIKGYETAKNYTWVDWGMRIEEKLLADYS